MVMKHAGLDISDDAIRCIEYSGHTSNFRISKYSVLDLPSGVIEGGEIKNELALTENLAKIDKDLSLTYAKVSVPEEKSYLFQTDVSTTDPIANAQNIEFKFEENVPLALSEAVFYFDLLPMSVTGGKLKASVSVVPKSYIEKIVTLLRVSGISPIAFEVVPKSIARAILSQSITDSVMVVHVMNKKTGIYVISGGVVCFTSTVSWGDKNDSIEVAITTLLEELVRINAYWTSHHSEASKLGQVILVGRNSSKYESAVSEYLAKEKLIVSVGNVWSNAFSLDNYIPPIVKEQSLEYVVSAGLAMDL
jgi:Tfp pilus assembly PilM family ATPase